MPRRRARRSIFWGAPCAAAPNSAVLDYLERLRRMTAAPVSCTLRSELQFEQLGRLLRASWGLLGGLLGASWGPPGSSWGPLGGSWGVLAASWGPLGYKMIFDCDLQATWRRVGGDLGPSWGRPGPSLGSSWRLLGPLGALLEPLGAVLGPLGGLLGPCWSHLGLLKARIADVPKNATPPTRNARFGRQDEAKMGPRWAKLGSSWPYLSSS